MNERCFKFLRPHVFSTFWINQCRYVSPLRSNEIMLGQRFMLKETRRRVYGQIVSFSVSWLQRSSSLFEKRSFLSHSQGQFSCLQGSYEPTTSLLGCRFKAKQQLCRSYLIPLDWTIHNVILFKKRVQETPCWEERAIDGEARGRWESPVTISLNVQGRWKSVYWIATSWVQWTWQQRWIWQNWCWRFICWQRVGTLPCVFWVHRNSSH